MGQYHRIVNLTKGEYLYPHRFNDGLKLMEFGCSATGTMLGLALLLARDNGRGGGDAPVHPVIGRWAGDKIAIVGDYGDDGQDLPHDWQVDWLLYCRREQAKARQLNDAGLVRRTEEMETAQPNLYTFAQACMTDISAVVIEAAVADSYVAGRLQQGPAERAESAAVKRKLGIGEDDEGNDSGTPADPGDTTMFNI